MAFTYGTITYTKDSNGTISTAFQVRLGYQLNSQREEDGVGISNITLQLEARSINSQYKTYGYNQTTTIDGTRLSAKTFDFRNTNVWQIFGSRTFDVTHDENGNYSITKNGSFQTTASGAGRPYTGSANVLVDLPNISLQTIRIRVNGEWKRAFPYVRINGEWKKAKAYIRANGEWKKGK